MALWAKMSLTAVDIQQVKAFITRPVSCIVWHSSAAHVNHKVANNPMMHASPGECTALVLVDLVTTLKQLTISFVGTFFHCTGKAVGVYYIYFSSPQPLDLTGFYWQVRYLVCVLSINERISNAGQFLFLRP